MELRRRAEDQIGQPPTVWDEIKRLREDVDTLTRKIDRWAGIFVGLSIAIQMLELGKAFKVFG
jgi:hypothetical protein